MHEKKRRVVALIVELFHKQWGDHTYKSRGKRKVVRWNEKGQRVFMFGPPAELLCQPSVNDSGGRWGIPSHMKLHDEKNANLLRELLGF